MSTTNDLPIGMLEPDAPAQPITFEQAWKTYEAKGYRYGADALEQVRFGWEIAQQFLGVK
jgi:hypothetical protein